MKTLIYISLLTFTLSSFSQDTLNKKNYNLIYIGTGIPSYNLLYPLQTTSPVFHLKYEKHYNSLLSWGINLAYFYQNSIPYKQEACNSPTRRTEIINRTYSSASLIARLNFNLIKVNKVTIYTGLGIGLRYGTYSVGSGSTGLEKIPIGFETTLGIRYFLTKNVGVYTEFGAGKSTIQGGIIFKL